MQSFLPYADFKKTAKCLDYRRLGKQRVEAKQIYNILTGQQKSNAWKHHPAILMWKGFESGLAEYHNICITEWIFRGYKNSMPLLSVEKIIYPTWLGNEKFHSSHRSNLLRKDFTFYSQYGWKEENNLPYVWPTKED